MIQVKDDGLPMEEFGVFQVTQITRGTAIEPTVAVDLVTIEPGKTSEVHRHNQAETVLLILEGSGLIRVGDETVPVSRGARVRIGKGVFHGVKTEGEGLRFLSVQSPPILDKTQGRLDLEVMSGDVNR